MQTETEFMLMYLRKIAFAAALCLTSVWFIACNSHTTNEIEEVTESNAAVRSFSLSANTNLMYGLDSVYFSIDLVKGLIFNADSLPYETAVTRLVPVVVTGDGASVIELKVTRANGTDTVYDYITNSTDTIDFTNPVNLRIVSKDGRAERNYTVTVNVHKVKSDSLAWGDNGRTLLPTPFAAPEHQRTVRSGDTFYCLTSAGSQYCMASHSGNFAGLNGAVMNIADWTRTAVTFPFMPVVESLAAADDAIYILDTAGKLYRSVDGGASWQPTGLEWEYIYGGYADRVLGTARNAGSWSIQTYPDATSQPLPDGMPVSGASVPVYYDFPMAANPQMLIVGGRLPDGSLSAATWGYDGNNWAKISKRNLPVALADVAVAPYFTVSGKSWAPVSRATLIAMGGIDSGGNPTDSVYISDDYGFTWRTAKKNMKLPAYLGKFSGAQAYVMSSTYHVADIMPKIARPTESWECPFIYLFGGVGEQGETRNVVWRGVINSMTFRPIE